MEVIITDSVRELIDEINRLGITKGDIVFMHYDILQGYMCVYDRR